MLISITLNSCYFYPLQFSLNSPFEGRVQDFLQQFFGTVIQIKARRETSADFYTFS